MRAKSLVFASLLTAALAPAQSEALSIARQVADPVLTYSPHLRGLELVAEPGRVYVVIAGLQQTAVPLGTIVVRVVPDAFLQIGRVGTLGHAYVPVNATGGGTVGDVVYAQALLWPADPGSSVLPDQATGVASIELIGPQTEPPADPPAERMTLVNRTSLRDLTADLAVADGLPPMYLAVLSVQVPTGGHVLRVDSVRHAGAFTRVFATVERPHPSEVVTEALERLDAIAELGIWVGDVEVVVREVMRAPVAKLLGSNPPSRE